MKDILTNYYQPLFFPFEWRKLLADPIKHWKDGKSAKELVKLWASSDELPQSVRELFPKDEINALFCFPEYSVPMPANGGASKNDLYVLARINSSLMVIMVEGKAGEFFGQLVSAWYFEKQKNKDKGKNAANRLGGILTELGLSGYDKPPYPKIGNLRYQLFHRTASALLEAKRIYAHQSLVLIQSFRNDTKSFNDFKQFLNILSINEPIYKNTLLGPLMINEVELNFAWLDC